MVIRRIINHFTYRKKLKLLKVYAVNQLSSIIINNMDYVEGFKRLLLTASKSDNAEELQNMLNEFIDLSNKVRIANKVINEKQTEESKAE